MRHLQGKGGFSLVELLVSITLLAVGILAVVQMQVVGLQANSFAQRLSVATNIAQEVMDDIQSWDLNSGVFNADTPETQVDFLTDPRLATSRDQTVLTFPDAGTYTAFYTITRNPDGNTAVILVRVLRQRPVAIPANPWPLNQFEERLRITSFKRIA